MVKQILAPGVKDGKKADDGAEMLGIGGNGLERFSGGPEENAVDGASVLQGDVGNLFRHGKDDVKIFGVQNLGLPVLDPLGACEGLALGTVAVRASNGELSITCFMGSISLWRVGSLNYARSKGRTRVQLTIKIWLIWPSGARSVCPAAGMIPSAGVAERQPQWPRVFLLDRRECRFQ